MTELFFCQWNFIDSYVFKIKSNESNKNYHSIYTNVTE